MDIKSEKGVKIVFNRPDNGYNHQKEAAKKHLEVGKEYTVVRTEISDWHTDVYLEEVPKIAFNSVMFD